MQIVLKIKGENDELQDKTFIQPFVPAMYYRRALALLTKIESGELDEAAALDEQLELVTGIFNKQFTLDELENGLDARNVNETLWDIIRHDILGWKTYQTTMSDIKKSEDFLQQAQETAKGDQ